MSKRDPYIEARLRLLEECFSQLISMLPAEVGTAIVAEYNKRLALVQEEFPPEVPLIVLVGPH